MGLELVKCVIPCQRENQNILIFDIDGKILCVFAPNGPHIVYLIPNIQQHQDIHLIWVVPLKNDLIVDGVTFNS